MLPEFRIATHPGQILLAEFLEPLRLTQAELARSLRIPLNRVNELVRGKRGITPESALLLSEYFRNSPEFWRISKRRTISRAHGRRCASAPAGSSESRRPRKPAVAPKAQTNQRTLINSGWINAGRSMQAGSTQP